MIEIKKYEIKVQKLLENLKLEIIKFRGNVSNASILNNILIHNYGTKMPIFQIAKITVQANQRIIIKPYDKSNISEIVSVISNSNLGLHPQIQKDIIYIEIPPLTREKREETIKELHKCAQSYKIALRQIRHEAINAIKKDNTISKDLQFGMHNDIDNLINKGVKELTNIIKNKEESILKF